MKSHDVVKKSLKGSFTNIENFGITIHSFESLYVNSKPTLRPTLILVAGLFYEKYLVFKKNWQGSFTNSFTYCVND